MATVESLLKDNVTLKVECIDRLYLNGYVPRLQRPQNLWWFLHEHRGCPVISPVLVKRLTDDFVRKIDRFAKANTVPVVHFDKGACKEEIAPRERFSSRSDLEGAVLVEHPTTCPPKRAISGGALLASVDGSVLVSAEGVPKSHRYMLTAQGRKIALFMTKSYTRVVRPIFQRLDPSLPEDTPGPLRRAWKACEKEIDKVVTEARLAA